MPNLALIYKLSKLYNPLVNVFTPTGVHLGQIIYFTTPLKFEGVIYHYLVYFIPTDRSFFSNSLAYGINFIESEWVYMMAEFHNGQTK